jgi:hypothetical protein
MIQPMPRRFSPKAIVKRIDHPFNPEEYFMSIQATTPVATATAGSKLLTPADHTLVMIDFQSQMAFATHSIDAVNLRNNAALVAQAAAGFKVPTILTTVAEKSFSGPMFSEITDAFPGQKMLDRTSMNTWEDAAVIERVNAIGKPRIVLAGLWTSVCIVGPALSALVHDARSLQSRRQRGGHQGWSLHPCRP